jgi:glycosyltransferase involved in cell wall biosynthesis
MIQKRILINAVAAKSGGAATYVINLAQRIASIGSPHHYIFYVPNGMARVIRDTGCALKVVETSAGEGAVWKRFLWDQVTLRSILKREEIDVVISSSDFGILFPPCRQVLLIRNALFFSLVYRQTIVPRQSWRFRVEFLLRRSLILASARFSDIVLVASQAMLNEVQRFARLPLERIAVNHFGVPLERFELCTLTSSLEEPKSFNQPFCILYVSEYGDYKNFKTLFKTIKVLSNKGVADFTVVTTADPCQYPNVQSVTREEDQALAVHPLVASFVKCSGYVPYETVTELYKSSDLFVFPSITESFGHPLVEAMASGLPIIASDIPVCREICGEVAIYFNPFDEQDLADKILKLKRDPDLRLRMGQAGRNRVKIHFNWNDHVRRLINLIEEVSADA